MIQLISCGLMNPHIGNFLAGKIYRGELKNFCTPGLNCYSCPAATFACPIGALQAVGGTANFNFSFYVAGFLILIGAIFGRAICAFVCPFGLFQEIFYKLPTKKLNLWRPLIYIKYFVLIIFVLILPATVTNFAGVGAPAFCEYICPAGTLEAGLPLIATHSEYRNILGELFTLKFSFLILTIIGSLTIYRFFCRVLCPLGAIYSILNRYSIYNLFFYKKTCIDCGKCSKICKMKVKPNSQTRSAECILCGECEKVCPTGAICLGFNKNVSAKEENFK
jgi:polyferredoxin